MLGLAERPFCSTSSEKRKFAQPFPNRTDQASARHILFGNERRARGFLPVHNDGHIPGLIARKDRRFQFGFRIHFNAPLVGGADGIGQRFPRTERNRLFLPIQNVRPGHLFSCLRADLP